MPVVTRRRGTAYVRHIARLSTTLKSRTAAILNSQTAIKVAFNTPFDGIPGLWHGQNDVEVGFEEMEWLRTNRNKLTNYRGLWVAIVKQSVVASDTSFDQVYQSLVTRNIRDAFVTYVPTDADKWDYVVA